MKKLKYGKQMTFGIILISGILGLFILAVIIFQIDKNYKEKRLRGTHVNYETGHLSSNGNYIGIIDQNNEKVSIVDKRGKEISHVDIKENYPNQIALGKNSYFLLYLWESDDGDARIVQYDYLSNKINESKASNTASIACRDGYLFVGKWRHDECDDYYDFFEAYYNGFYANQYVEEKQFGSGLHDLVLDEQKKCRVGDVDFYYHEKGYFSTEPEWGDYPGTSEGDFWSDDKSRQADTKQERKNRTHLLKEINGTENNRELNYRVAEYQVGNTIYGVCNIYENAVNRWPIESEDVLQSCCYQINRETDELEIMSQVDSHLGIVASDAVFVYLKDSVIIRQNIETGVEEVLYQFQNIYEEEIYPQGDYLLVVDDKKCIPVLWNEKSSGFWNEGA